MSVSMSDADTEFSDELRATLNRHCRESASNTPDYILAEFLLRCLDAFDFAVMTREGWYGQHHVPGGGPSTEAPSEHG